MQADTLPELRFLNMHNTQTSVLDMHNTQSTANALMATALRLKFADFGLDLALLALLSLSLQLHPLELLSRRALPLLFLLSLALLPKLDSFSSALRLRQSFDLVAVGAHVKIALCA